MNPAARAAGFDPYRLASNASSALSICCLRVSLGLSVSAFFRSLIASSVRLSAFMTAARVYQGQTTNFRTPGGGFAPVFVT